MTVKKSEATLLKFIYDHFSGVTNIELREFSFTGATNVFYTSAYSRIDDLTVAVSLPIESDTSFMCISDADPLELCKIVSTLQSYHECQSQLGYGHTVPLNTNAYVVNHGWHAVLVLSADLFIDNFDARIADQLPGVEVLLAILITDTEHAFKTEKGLDHLLDRFDEIQRDITAFGAALDQQ